MIHLTGLMLLGLALLVVVLLRHARRNQARLRASARPDFHDMLAELTIDAECVRPQT